MTSRKFRLLLDEYTRLTSQPFPVLAGSRGFPLSAADGGTTRHLIETILKKRGVKVTSQLIYEIMEKEGI